MDALDDAERGVGTLELLAQDREADVVHARRRRTPRGSARRGSPARPSARRPRGGPRPSRPTRGCGAGSRPRRTRGRPAGRACSRRSGRSRPWAACYAAIARGPSVAVDDAHGSGHAARLDGDPHRIVTSRRDTRRCSRPRPAPHLTPVLGRYFERSGATARAIDSSTPTVAPYLDFANGIAVTALGHAHPRVNAAIHAQVDRLVGPDQRRSASPSRSRDLADARRDLPRPDRLDHVPEFGVGGDRRRAQARSTGHRPARHHRVPRRLPRADVRGDGVTTSNINYRTGYEPMVPAVYFAPFPAAYRRFGGDEEAARSNGLATSGR